jgi:hypothetical protein
MRLPSAEQPVAPGFGRRFPRRRAAPAPSSTGGTITVLLAHILQAGANTLTYQGAGAAAIKSSLNPSNNIATAYSAGGVIQFEYNGSVWLDLKQ